MADGTYDTVAADVQYHAPNWGSAKLLFDTVAICFYLVIVVQTLIN
jgi:hypothetical protein